ncbi:MAG TPA: methyltransferase domain-containing protein [Gemmatimonadaceae bacterium]|nr:methyltransferase domain-containing protein [Gemmatimonadaceae bacterium]
MGWLTPARRRGVEILDDPATPGPLRERSQRDVVRSNTVLGGTRAVLRELRAALPLAGPAPTLLDVGTGLADIPARASRRAGALTTVGYDVAEPLLAAARGRMTYAVCGDALALPFATASVDVVICSQLLHHFVRDDAVRLVRELHRVARHAVIVSDLRRSWLAAAGFWLASFPLRFHAVTRHDGVVSVLRGFTAGELAALVRDATGATPRVRRRLGYRLTAVWSARVAGR